MESNFISGLRIDVWNGGLRRFSQVSFAVSLLAEAPHGRGTNIKLFVRLP
jgi:hypothetical protein